MLCPYCMKHNEWSSPRRKMLRAVARIVTKFWAWGVERPLLAYSYVVLESSICGYSAVDWDPLSICYMHGHGCIRNLHFVNCYYVRSVLSTCASYGTCCTRIYAPYTVSGWSGLTFTYRSVLILDTYIRHTPCPYHVPIRSGQSTHSLCRLAPAGNANNPCASIQYMWSFVLELPPLPCRNSEQLGQTDTVPSCTGNIWGHLEVRHVIRIEQSYYRRNEVVSLLQYTFIVGKESVFLPSLYWFFESKAGRDEKGL